MAGEWAPIVLGEVCTKIGSGATPKGGADVYLEVGPYALIRSQNIYNNGFHHDGLAYIGDDHATELVNVEVLEDDVLLNITGDSVARVCQVPRTILPARVNQHVAIIRPDPNRLHPRFLWYSLASPEIQSKLLSWAGSGGTRNALTKGMIESFDVLAPNDIDEQRAIAHILGSLDDKIELNRKMNATLEEMARAIFKSWFVDFEPVRAKMEGRWQRGQSLPGLPAHLFDLFPDKLVDSELGEIPEGWQIKSLDQIALFLNGLALQKYTPTDSRSLPVIKIAQLRSGQTNNADHASADLNPDYIVADGDILFSWSGSLECKLWVGGSGALNQHLFKVTPKDYPRWLCYFTIHHHLSEFRHIATGKATTMGHIQRHHLSDAKIAIPAKSVLNEVNTYLSSSFEMFWKREIESRTLASLRDTLLPKLISGQIRIKDAERFLKERGL